MFLCVGLIIFNMGMIYKIQIWDACLCYENTLGLGLYLGGEDILLMGLYLALHFRSKIFWFLFSVDAIRCDICVIYANHRKRTFADWVFI